MRGKDCIWMAATVTAYILGAATAILVMRDRIEKKYKRIAREEIDSVKEVFSRRKEEPPKAESQSAETYTRILRVNGYSGPKAPYIITPDEFGEADGYDTVSLTYYADGVLTDENDEPIDESDDIFKSNFQNHFGEYEDDSVFVRNEAAECDYEILYDSRDYSEVRM